ncbi:MAG TPA: hypothetical protein VN229_16545 [Terriglobales bacterium]|nr:hypothetical protein [Terriglobales bacterium]
MFFGYRIDDALYAANGLQVGRFHRDMIFSFDGHYLGEIRNQNRLVADLNRKSLCDDGFSPAMSMSYRRQADLPSLDQVPGFADFPAIRLFGSTAYLASRQANGR